MWILPLIGYLGILVGFCFLTLAIASGLYYLSELVEEHTVLTKKLLSQLIYFVVGVLVLLALVDRLPLFLSLLSIGSHAVYAGNLRRFPFVRLSDPLFIISCLLVLLNHYLWFSHFSTLTRYPPPPYRDNPHRTGHGSPPSAPFVTPPSFTEISSFFGICVWLVPFALFVSLSASDNVLPTMMDTGVAGGSDGLGVAGALGGRGKKKGMAGQVVDAAGRLLGETAAAFGWSSREGSRRF